MKKIKIISILLIALISISLFTGCNLVLGPVSAGKVYTKYAEIVENYKTRDIANNIIPTQSLFNANDNLIITYKECNFAYEIEQRPDSIFNVFDEQDGQYSQTLYSAIAFFNQYRNSLNVTANNWDLDKIKVIYTALLDWEGALKDFQTKKTAVENMDIIYNEENLTSPYSYTTMVKFNDFKDTYNLLLEKTIIFVKLFEKSYVTDILNTDSYLIEAEVPFYEVRRVVYTAELYLAEATYNYYVKHLGDYDALGADNTLFEALFNLKADVANINFLDSGFTQADVTNYYRLTRANEGQIISQSSFYVNAIKTASNLKDSTNEADINLYNDYVSTINQTTDNYINYASFAAQLIVNVEA